MYPTSGRQRSSAQSSQPSRSRPRPTLHSPPTSPSYVPFPFFSLLSAMTSPRTPAHSRVSSGVAVDIHYTDSPYGSPQYQRRRTSNASYMSHTSHRSRASFGSQGGMSNGGFSNGGLSDLDRRTPDRGMSRSDSLSFAGGDGVFSSGGPLGNDFGNLADELAEAWNSEEEEEVDMKFAGVGAGAIIDSDSEESRQKEMLKIARDSGVSVSGSPIRTLNGKTPKKGGLSPPKRRRRSGSEYEGSDYGTCSDADETSLPPALIERMDHIESIARRGSEANGSASSNVVPRVIEGLKAIGGQTGIEMGATRLITAHTAMSTHILYQTRSLQTLTYPLIGPFAVQPSEEIIDEILPLLVDLSESMPRPDRPALEALAGLNSTTRDLTASLGGLADTLHMSRQTTTLAARRLKVAKELVEDLREEEEMREEGHRHLLKGGWDQKLHNREASRECKDVLEGFERFCEEYRAKLVKLGEQQEVAAAA